MPDILCDGSSDACTGVATTTRDTTGGYQAPADFCEPCADAWDTYIDNYEPGDPDGEALRGGEAAARERELAAEAWKLK